MRKITKGAEPAELVRWKRRNSDKRYDLLGNTERKAIRLNCLAEQYFLCAFCCSPTDLEHGRNAHLQCRSYFPQKSLDWDNIVVSCASSNTCDVFQGRALLPLTPLMEECESEFKFYQSGKVIGLTKRAKQTIKALNLDCPSLRQRRANAIRNFLYDAYYFPPEEDIFQWDKEIWNNIIEVCCRPDEKGKLAPYAPVLENIGRQLLNQ